MEITAVRDASISSSVSKPVDSNYIDRIIALVARSLAQQNRSKTTERGQIEELKKRYQDFSRQSGNLNVAMGNTGFYGAMASLGLMLAPQFLPMPSIFTPEVTKYLAEQGSQSITQLINGRSMAEQKQDDAVAALAINEYQSKTTNQNSSSNQEAINLVNQVLELQKRASSS